MRLPHVTRPVAFPRLGRSLSYVLQRFRGSTGVTVLLSCQRNRYKSSPLGLLAKPGHGEQLGSRLDRQFKTRALATVALFRQRIARITRMFVAQGIREIREIR